MGNKQSLNDTSLNDKTEKSKLEIIALIVSKNMFEFLYVVGKGGFGKVNINNSAGLESSFEKI